MSDEEECDVGDDEGKNKMMQGSTVRMNVGETGASRLINILNTKKVAERHTVCQSSINFVKNVIFKYYELMKVMPH